MLLYTVPDRNTQVTVRPLRTPLYISVLYVQTLGRLFVLNVRTPLRNLLLKPSRPKTLFDSTEYLLHKDVSREVDNVVKKIVFNTERERDVHKISQTVVVLERTRDTIQAICGLNRAMQRLSRNLHNGKLPVSYLRFV